MSHLPPGLAEFLEYLHADGHVHSLRSPNVEPIAWRYAKPARLMGHVAQLRVQPFKIEHDGGVYRHALVGAAEAVRAAQKLVLSGKTGVRICISGCNTPLALASKDPRGGTWVDVQPAGQNML